MKSRFINFAPGKVEELQSRDRAVQTIRDFSSKGSRISFRQLRGTFGEDNGIWDELNRGRAILASTRHLDQYLHSYGLMVEGQWKHILSRIEITTTPFHLIDYGCGQGLAGLMFSDHFDPGFLSIAKSIKLIDHSAAALVRAEAIYRNITPHALITCICKPFDDLSSIDLISFDGLPKFHIFSNVLDIEGFDHIDLFEKILKSNSNHMIISVSNDRNTKGGSQRIFELKDKIDDHKIHSRFSIQYSEINRFQFKSNSKSDTRPFSNISWISALDKLNG